MGTLAPGASMLEVALHQGNHDRKHKFWNVSTERYNVHTPSAVAAGMLLHTNNKFTMETVK